MTESEFDEIWQRIVLKWGSKAEWHSSEHPDKSERLEYEHWKKALCRINKHLVSSALGYYTQHLDKAGFWPRLPVILDCIDTVHKSQQGKKDWGKKQDGVPITREFHQKMVELDGNVQAGKVPVGFRDNNFEGQGNFTTVKSMAECLVEMYRSKWVNPAMSDERKRRAEEERKDRPKDDLIQNEHGKKVCYYCGTSVTRPNLGSKNGKGVDIADYYECHKCQVTFKNEEPVQEVAEEVKEEVEEDLPF